MVLIFNKKIEHKQISNLFYPKSIVYFRTIKVDNFGTKVNILIIEN